MSLKVFLTTQKRQNAFGDTVNRKSPFKRSSSCSYCESNLDYSKEGPAGSERVKDIKVQVTRRPNGQKLLKIANLITTPFFSIILQQMYNLKFKSYSPEDLEEKFEEMVDDWLNSSL